MNGTRTTQLGTRRAPPYEDTLFQMMGKDFSDKSTRSVAPNSSSSIPHPHPTALDQYSQMRSGASSNVLDPSEFPSLGGGLGGQGGIPVSAAALLSSSAPLDVSGLGNVGIPVPSVSVNGLGPYADMYNIAGYGDGRAKAVDAVTGTSATSEFNMQSEDFPALGGNPASVGLRGSNLMNSLPNGPSLLSAGGGRLGLGASMGKPGVSDSLFDGNGTGDLHSQQLHAVQGRGPGRSDLANGGMLMGRTGQISNDYQISDGQSNTAIQQLARNGTAHEQNCLPQDVGRSPPKGAFHMRSQAQAAPSRGQSAEPEGSRKGQDDFTALGIGDGRSIASQLPNDVTLPNGDGLGMGGFASNGPGGKPQAASSLLTRIAGNNQDGAKKGSPTAVLPADQYGMKGLLKYVGPEAEGTDANMLSIGVDLTMLGLDLNSPEPLYKSFSSPWEGGQGGVPGTGDVTGTSQKSEEPEYKLPTCYYMQPPALKNSHFTKFQLETLFYVFYNMPRDILQVLAAIELYTRKWMYHKDLKLWFTCEPEVLQGYERGAYIYFDIKSWEQRPFHDANQSFIQGLMTEDEVRSVPLPGPRSSAS